SIDLERCKDETVCYIRESCIESKTSKALIRYRADKLKEGECDVIMQVKPLTKSKLHFMLQVKGQNLKREHGIKLVQKADLFHCKIESDKEEITGNSIFILNFLGSNKFEPQSIFCSFTAEAKDKSLPFGVTFHSNSDVPSIVYSKDSGVVTAEYAHNEFFMWSEFMTAGGCNHDLVSTSNKADPNKENAWTEVDITRHRFTCPFSPASFMLEIPPDGTKSIVSSSVHCETVHWHYDLGGVKTKIEGKFAVFCSEKLCRKCSAPAGISCAGCTNATFAAASTADATSCASLKCDNGSFTVDGGKLLSGEAKCSKSAEGFEWNAEGTELKQAACLQKIDCTKPPQ
ncbi:hypothetical protein PFISCL1PPCAC_9367, partial [Pristionchus fissidentatus]